MSTQDTKQTATQTTAEQVVPTHLGLILDGNRRWARERGLPTLEGHRRGYGTLKTIGKAAIKRGVKYVSAFVFSTENWNRSQEEVEYLMDLLRWVATSEVNEMHKENIRVRMIGRPDGLDEKTLELIRKAEAKTAKNTGGTLGLCINYGGQQELADATAAMIRDGVKPDEVTPAKIGEYLYESDIPPIDLLIRTSGEQRLSGFMLYRSAYSELLFVKKHWPAFTEADLDSALATFANRERRFGK